MLDRDPKLDLGYVVRNKHIIDRIEGMAGWLRGLTARLSELAGWEGLLNDRWAGREV